MYLTVPALMIGFANILELHHQVSREVSHRQVSHQEALHRLVLLLQEDRGRTDASHERIYEKLWMEAMRVQAQRRWGGVWLYRPKRVTL